MPTARGASSIGGAEVSFGGTASGGALSSGGSTNKGGAPRNGVPNLTKSIATSNDGSWFEGIYYLNSGAGYVFHVASDQDQIMN